MMEEYLRSFNLLTEAEIEDALRSARPKMVPKGEFLIQEGQVSKDVAFIASGFCMSYYHNTAGEEVAFCFAFPNSFITAFSSFISQAPTAENIVALTDMELLMLSREKVQEVTAVSPNWARFNQLMAEEEYMRLEKRVFLLQAETAMEKYQDLLTHHPEYLQLIPQSYLASYLGITQRHLSRIRQQLTN